MPASRDGERKACEGLEKIKMEQEKKMRESWGMGLEWGREEYR